MEVFDDSSSSPSGTLRSYPLTCRVIYSYKASQPDELTIDEQEMLEVIEDGDMEDWVKARNKTGLIGYVPEKYLQFPASSSLLSMLSSLAALDTRSHTSSNSTEPEVHTELHTVCVNGDLNVVHVRALYSYCAQTEEELSFSEGSVIRLLTRDTQTDDGFWEGELSGRRGVFPSVLVEELTENGGGDSAPAGLGVTLTDAQKTALPLPPLPLYDQPPPMMPFTSPELCSPPPLPRSPSTNLNGEHKPLPLPAPSHSKPLPPPAPSHNKGPPSGHSHSSGRSPVSPGFPPPLRFTPDGGPAPGKLRPVRAAPPPPKQPPRRVNEKNDNKTTEEVEITLV